MRLVSLLGPLLLLGSHLTVALRLGAYLLLLLALDPNPVAPRAPQVAAHHALQQQHRARSLAPRAARQEATAARLQPLDGGAEADLPGASHPRATDHRRDRGRVAKLPQRAQPAHLGVEVDQAAHGRHRPAQAPQREQPAHLGEEGRVERLLAAHEAVDEGELARLEERLGHAEEVVRPAQVEGGEQCHAEDVRRELLELGRGERLEHLLQRVERQPRAVARTQQAHSVDHARVAELAEHQLVVEQVGLLLVVGLDAAHEVRVRSA
mmetsp:Transcript_21354/g.50649  ORF Transcript_21354/g.50649 Transcript_21354/m.50649 type:complete len:266 (-) Transcript_21354:498-1295(-)